MSDHMYARRAIILGLFSLLTIWGSIATNDSAAISSGLPAFSSGIIQADAGDSDIIIQNGKPAVIHITNIEIPICKECEKDLRAQIDELARLKGEYPDTQIVTINLRKNSYSQDGLTLVQKWWQANISWPWIEDLEPYKVAGKYSDYWNVRGGLSNPTILLADKRGQVVVVYHVYRVGEGEIDGIQSAESLHKKLEELNRSEWTSLEGQISKQNVSLFGIFVLGIVTSLAPCSIALMIAVFSYVMTVRRKDEYLRANTSTSREGFMIGVAFTLGMGVVFFILGLFISQVGVFIRDSRFFDLVAGVIMILLGISNIKPLGEMMEPVISIIRPLLKPLTKPGRKGEVREGGVSLIQRSVNTSIGLFRYSAFFGAFSLGIFFALGWAPCALSMIFPVLVWLASQNVTPLTGGVMLFVFGLGHGVPIIPISTFSRAVGGRIADKYVFVGRWTTEIFGLLVIAVGVVYAARYFGFVLW